MRWISAIAAVALAAGLLAPPARGQEYGDLTATFVFGGNPFVPDPLEITKDKEFCGKFRVVDESLTVNPDNKGIAGVIAWLYLSRTDKAPEPHPSYAETADDKILLDNNQCRFAPHVMTFRTSQTLIIGNSDEVGHNCKIDTFANPPINYTIPAGGKFEHKLNAAERLPARVSCSIHPWMSGWVLVKDNPYMAVSDQDGKLVIKNLPVGKWTFQFWQEKSGYIDEVSIDGKKTAWPRGRLEIDIKAGTNDLGKLTLEPSIFAEN